MNLWAIIPVKPFDSGKSRLAGVLDATARAALSRRLFDHVFEVALAALGAERVAVVTPDAGLREQIVGRGAHAVAEGAAGNLNAALAEACRYALHRGAEAVMVLPADLPFVTTQDIDSLRAASGTPPCYAIAPDRSGRATNALLVAPPDPDIFRFGPGSFAAHVEAAAARNTAPAIVRRPGFAFDLDTSDDYREFAGAANSAGSLSPLAGRGSG